MKRVMDAIRLVLLLITSLLLLSLLVELSGVTATVPPLSEQLTPEEYDQLQQRLVQTGFYSGKISAIYESETSLALLSFQQASGLVPNGIVGAATRKKLGLAFDTTQMVQQEQLDLLATMIDAVAKDESFAVKRAVGQVYCNRIKSPLFADSLAEMVEIPKPSILARKISTRAPSDQTLAAATQAYCEVDTTDGALYFFDLRTTSDEMLAPYQPTIVVDSFVFCTKDEAFS